MRVVNFCSVFRRWHKRDEVEAFELRVHTASCKSVAPPNGKEGGEMGKRRRPAYLHTFRPYLLTLHPVMSKSQGVTREEF